jgi:hypothetical protein
MLEQAAVTARELETLAQRSDVLVSALRSATLDASLQVRGILNHLFVLLALLVLVIAAAALLTALAYRRIPVRLQRPSPRPL